MDYHSLLLAVFILGLCLDIIFETEGGISMLLLLIFIVGFFGYLGFQ